MGRRPGGTATGGPAGPVRRSRGVLLAGVAVLSLAAGAAGCVGEPEARDRPSVTATVLPTPMATSASPRATHADVCSRARAAQNSLTALMNLDFAGIGGVQGTIGQVQADLAALRKTASAEWESQVAALSAEVSRLGAAVNRLQDQKNVSQGWQAVRAAAAGVGESAQRLRRKLSSICPSLPDAQPPDGQGR